MNISDLVGASITKVYDNGFAEVLKEPAKAVSKIGADIAGVPPAVLFAKKNDNGPQGLGS